MNTWPKILPTFHTDKEFKKKSMREKNLAKSDDLFFLIKEILSLPWKGLFF